MKRSQSNGTPNPKRPSLAQHDSDDELESTQRMIVNTQDENETKVEKKQAAEANIGVLERVELTDFMCHARLVVDLCPNVNFILGRNGSGKSAIMTAIVVALGGNARATERGRSLKEFIRSGCSRAVVQVQVRNRGTDGYLAEKYGATIVIERTIKTDGTGSYKIKNKRGTVVSTKKEDLVRILDHMDIQVNNPICMLNQDVSRNFLHSSNPKDKYKLFMRATLLEDIEKCHEKTKENLVSMTALIRVQEQRLPELEAKAKELEEKVEMFDHIRKQGERVLGLEKLLQWALIAEIEKNIPPIEGLIEKERKRIPKNQQKMDTAKAKAAECDAELKQIGKELDTITIKGADIQKTRQELLAERRAKEKAVRSSQAQMKAISREIHDKKKEKIALERKRDECIAMSQRDVEGEREARLKELEGHQERLAGLQRELETAEEDRRRFSNAARETKEQLHSLQDRIGYLASQVRESEEKIERLNSSNRDSLACFGNWTRPLVDALQRNASQFQKPPKGPIGAMIQLSDYKWGVAVEQVIKRSLLSAFIVDNQQDKATFKRVMAQVLRRGSFTPDIVVSRYSNNVYNTSRNRARSNHPTVLDVVTADDPDVLNVLIDQCRIESVLLIEERDAANRVIVHNRPSGANRAFTLEGDEILPYAHYSNRSGRFGILKSSNTDAIREERGKLDHLNGQLGELHQRKAELQGEVRASEKHEQEAKQRIRTLHGHKGSLERAIVTLKEAEEEEDSQEDIATYDGEVAECEEKLTELSTRLSAQKEEIVQLNQELSEITTRCQEVQNDAEEVAGSMEELRARNDEALRQKREAANHMKFYEDRVASVEKDIAELQAKADEYRKAALEATENAAGERIQTNRSSKNIESEIAKLRRRIAEEEPNVGQHEEIQRLYVEAMEEYVRAQTNIDEQAKLHSVLERSLMKRMRGFETIRNRVITMTCVYFTHFLRQRDYDGKLRFDHKGEKLEIKVNVDQHTEQSQLTKNAKSLSGGERSYTTVCFILSLWYVMSSPFQCLDEFDVFMDMMNRRICMRLMLDFSQENSCRQFIFFTPQDMSSMGVDPSSRVKVFKLNPPERGQTTLD